MILYKISAFFFGASVHKLRFRDKKVLRPLAGAIVGLLQVHRRAKDGSPLKKWSASIINQACRELEDFVVPHVSVAAAARAKGMRLPDLQAFHWDDQRKKMKDPKRRVFHWEHFIPVKVLRGRLLGLRTVGLRQVEAVLRHAEVAWILKRENRHLRHKGRITRKDAEVAYATAGIVLKGR